MSADKALQAATRNATEEEVEAMMRLSHQRVQISIDGLSAVFLLANIQLALRHDENDGPASQSMTSLAWMIRDDLVGREPKIASIVDGGWAGIPSNRRN